MIWINISCRVRPCELLYSMPQSNYTSEVRAPVAQILEPARVGVRVGNRGDGRVAGEGVREGATLGTEGAP